MPINWTYDNQLIIGNVKKGYVEKLRGSVDFLPTNGLNYRVCYSRCQAKFSHLRLS